MSALPAPTLDRSLTALPADVRAELRTDHAGELGAVYIYRAVLALARDPALRAFAEQHLVTEQKHLDVIESWLPAAERSRLLPLWRLSGWMVGGVPALFGPAAVYATIAAVETFVDRHYQTQVDALAGRPELALLRDDLEACRQDEVHHREDAEAHGRTLASRPGPLLRGWCAIVGRGSELAVGVCRHV